MPGLSAADRSKVNRDNQKHGKCWEDILVCRAQSNGLLAVRNPLSAKMLYKGRVQVTKSQLDFTLIARKGRWVSYFDAKCWDRPHATFSLFDEDQLKKATDFNAWGITAGFVVWFRPIDRIVFFSGELIRRLGYTERFDETNGLDLGNLTTFDLRLMMATGDPRP